ncbi:hypothetical protein RRSWK_01181 [Rhodopirellula sp. SWK7]|nr:hypothetical protein RRSWK_01181 [Rhodopirellula sp. SWK7]
MGKTPCRRRVTERRQPRLRELKLSADVGLSEKRCRANRFEGIAVQVRVSWV